MSRFYKAATDTSRCSCGATYPGDNTCPVCLDDGRELWQLADLARDLQARADVVKARHAAQTRRQAAFRAREKA